MLLTEYPQGSNLTIMNTIYHYPVKNEQTGKYKKDYMTIVYKDNDTGKRSIKLYIDQIIHFIL